jgi:hypothetical protein
VERGGGRRSGGEEREGGHYGGIRGRRLYSAGIRADLHDHYAQHSPGIRRVAHRAGNQRIRPHDLKALSLAEVESTLEILGAQSWTRVGLARFRVSPSPRSEAGRCTEALVERRIECWNLACVTESSILPGFEQGGGRGGVRKRSLRWVLLGCRGRSEGGDLCRKF